MTTQIHNIEEHPDVVAYKQAVWDFLLEHCDLMPRGSFFFKFHASGRADLEKRIRARWKYNYHREDTKAKEAVAVELKTKHLTKKEAKAEAKKARKLSQAEINRAVREAAEMNHPQLSEKIGRFDWLFKLLPWK